MPEMSWITCLNVFREPFARLTDDFDLTNDSVLDETGLFEGRSAYPLGILSDFVNCLLNMLQVQGIVTLHRLPYIRLKSACVGKDLWPFQ